MPIYLQIKALIQKDLILDFREKFGLGGVFLYVFASFFIVYLSFGEVDGVAWVTLYWIVVLFGAVNAVLKSFTQEGATRDLYYYTLVAPLVMLYAKLMYNIVLVLLICVLSFLLFGVLTAFVVSDLLWFSCGVLLGAIGIAANFTLMSALASHTRNKNTMMMILSLPVIVPLLLPLVRLSIRCLEPVRWSNVQPDLTLLLSVDLLILGLALMLFPFLWKS